MSPIKPMSLRKKQRKTRVHDPVPCPLDYHPLDEYGCCPACERRAEAAALKEVKSD